MGIREAAMYPSHRAEETIWCTVVVLIVPQFLVWQLRASKYGYSLCEPIFSWKRYAGTRRKERRQNRQDTGLPTHWTLSLLIWLIVVARVCFVLVAMPFISSLEFDWFGGDRRRFSTVMWCVGYRKNQESRRRSHTRPSIHICNDWWLAGRWNGGKFSRLYVGAQKWVETRCVCFCGSEFVAWYFWNSGANLVSYVKEVALSRCSVGFVWFWAQCS